MVWKGRWRGRKDSRARLHHLKDQFFTPVQVDALEARLKKGHVVYELYRYQADHAFGNETGDHYDPEAAKLAWQRTFDFMEKHLKP